MLVVLILICVLFFIGVPVALGLAIAPLYGLMERKLPMLILPQSAFEMLDSFALLAIIYFVVAGRLMQTAGVARRLVDLAIALTGWMRGGLGSAAVLTTMMFSTMSGSSSATTAAVGGILTPEMARKGYPRPFIGSLLASAGELGIILPPSVPLIMYAVITGVSIGDLFLATIFPGLLVGVSLIATVVVIASVKGYGQVTPIALSEWAVGVWRAFRAAWLSLMMPVIVLGGIYGGFFTATEAAVVAIAYTLLIGIFVYREIEIRTLPRIFSDAAMTTSVVMLIAAFAAVLAYTLSIFQVPQMMSAAILSFSDSPVVFLIVVNILLIIAGTALETFAALIILAPVLAPAAAQLGIHPVHFGIIMNVNLAIGMITPPTAVNLFIMCTVAKVSMEQLMRPLAVFFTVMIVDLMIITYVPWLSTVLLN